MIDIYCTGGLLLGVNLKFSVMEEIMRGDFVRPNDFIEFRFEDGTRGSVRKKSINCFVECTDNQET